ncbi:hypothetical protein AHF37_00045 [Paragonimus kellicotti]|nr:hypothetical protein AHF37_00045 [Paragonimus kellicotti]
MLNQHNFFVANSFCAAQYTRELEVHATRVSHFLAACHPSEGLIYLLKHLEDITLSSTTGPSYVPLTRTLGPIGISIRNATVYSAIASLTAAAAIATEDYEDCTKCPAYSREVQGDNLPTTCSGFGTLSPLSCDEHYQSSSCLMGLKTYTHSSLSSSLQANEADQMNALCDEIEDIYYYVRNGRFPAQSHSMTSLIHHTTPSSMLDQLKGGSAPISPQLSDLIYDRTRKNPVQKQSQKTYERVFGNTLKLSPIHAEQTKHLSLVLAHQKQEVACAEKHQTPVFQHFTGLRQFQTSIQKQQTQSVDLNSGKLHVNTDKRTNIGHDLLHAAAHHTKEALHNLPETSSKAPNLPVMVAQQLPAYYGTEHGNRRQKWYTNKKMLKLSTAVESETRTFGFLADVSQTVNDSHNGAHGEEVMKPEVRHKYSNGTPTFTLVSPEKSLHTNEFLAVSDNKEHYPLSYHLPKQYLSTPFSSSAMTVSVSSGSNVMVRSMNWYPTESGYQRHHEQVPSTLMVHPSETTETSCISARLPTSPVRIIRFGQPPKQTWFNTTKGLDHMQARQIQNNVGDPSQNVKKAKIPVGCHKQASHLPSVQETNQSRTDEFHPYAPDTSGNRCCCACQSNFSNNSVRSTAWRHFGDHLNTANVVLDNKHTSPHNVLQKVYSNGDEKRSSLKKEQISSPYYSWRSNTLPQLRQSLTVPSTGNEAAADFSGIRIVTPRRDLSASSRSSSTRVPINYAPAPIQSGQTFKSYYADQLKNHHNTSFRQTGPANGRLPLNMQ